MVQKFRDKISLLPPATWISIISILGVGFMAFGAVKYTGLGNAADIDSLQVQVDALKKRSKGSSPTLSWAQAG
jgi:hypothetical protein